MLSQIVSEGWEEISDETFISTLGHTFQRLSGELIQTALLTDQRHRNLAGTVHGGAIMTLIDRAIGINCLRLRPDHRVATLSTTVNFHSPANIGSFLVAECSIRKTGRNVTFVEADVTSGDKLIASASAVFLLSPTRD